MKKVTPAVAAACLALAFTALPALAQNVVVDTNPVWNGSNFISTFGIPNTETYGQTIVVPVGQTMLQSFSFQINAQGNAVPFRGEVYAWNGTRATGTALYESAPMTTTADSNYHRYTFTPGVPVVGGQAYVIFATTSREAQVNAGTRWGSIGNNSAYPSGQFVFLNNGTDTTQWTANTWSTIADDLAFSVAFTGSGVGSQDVPALSRTMLVALAAAIALAGALALRFRS